MVHLLLRNTVVILVWLPVIILVRDTEGNNIQILLRMELNVDVHNAKVHRHSLG